MRSSLVAMLALIVPAAAVGGTSAPLSWSQDGRWVAYTVSGREQLPTLAPGWLFTGAPVRVDAEAGAPPVYRIYAADAETGASVLLEESGALLTSPAWSPDGRSLAFGRVVVDAGPAATARYEVVIQDAPGKNRLLFSQALAAKPADLEGWTALVPAWSPDGHFLAVPDLKATPTLSVVRVDDGRLIQAIDGSLPAWSPDGTKLAFVRAERVASLLVVDIGVKRADPSSSPLALDLKFGPARHLVDLGQTYQAPAWSRDGRSLTAVASRAVVGRLGPVLRVDLLRVGADSGSVEVLTPLLADAVEPENAFRGACLSHDRDFEEMFYSLDVAGQPAVIVWHRPKKTETVDRINPVNFALRVGSLSFSPNGKTLALRYGDPAGAATTALYDVWTKRLTLLASDDPSRLEWVTLLIGSAGRIIKASVPAATVAGVAVDRPTVLPVPGEIPANQEGLIRLQKLGRLGRPLCEPASAAAKASPEVATYLDEARLFFDAIREDYPAALASLDALEARTSSPDHLGRLLAVRAQIFLGMDDVDRATDTIGFLRSIEDVPVSRFEATPGGPVLTPESGASGGWGDYLSARLDDLSRSQSGKADREGDDAFAPAQAVPVMPQAPFPAVPFDRLPNGVFVAPENAPLNGPFLPAPPPLIDDGPGAPARFRPRVAPLAPRRQFPPAGPR